MPETRDVTLAIANLDDAPLLANLLELYQHDLSDCFPVEIGADGRFGYQKLPLYWSEPERRFPLLIRYGTNVAGFVLVMLGSPISNDPTVHDIAEFFVLRRYRRSGVGRRAARALWDQYPGRWVVRVFERNVGAVTFWERVISEYVRDRGTVMDRSFGSPAGWYVYSFTSGEEKVKSISPADL
jgi:predicted acetyltransferase